MSDIRARSIALVLAITLAAGVIAAACGGSATESPWPIEPDSLVLGPQGEEGRTRPTNEVPDAGSDAAPNVEP